MKLTNKLFSAIIFLFVFTGISNGSEKKLLPFLETYCYKCHGIEDEASDLSIKHIMENGGLSRYPGELEDILFSIKEGDMPTKKGVQPSDKKREEAVKLLSELVTFLQNSQKNDPGHVVLPRLTKAEYNRVIEDISGYPISPAKFFPEDIMAGEGFGNVGAAQATTMGDIERFLNAAEYVTQYLRVSPKDGIRWFPSPQTEMPTEKDRRDQLKRELFDAYNTEQGKLTMEPQAALRIAEKDEQNNIPGFRTKYYTRSHLAYWKACWKIKHRKALGQSSLTFEKLAAERPDGLIKPYIAKKWLELLESKITKGHFSQITKFWKSLPGPSSLSGLSVNFSSS